MRFKEKSAVSVAEKQPEQMSRTIRRASRSISVDEGSSKQDLQVMVSEASALRQRFACRAPKKKSPGG